MINLKVKIKITTEHLVNFGTGDKPNYKTAGDVVECDKDVADRLVAGGFAVYIESKKAKEDKR